MKNQILFYSLNYRNSFIFAGLFVVFCLAAATLAQTADNRNIDSDISQNSINSPQAESLKIIASNPTINAQFGSSMAIEGDTLVVGAPGERNEANVTSGAAYVFVRSGNGWTQQARIIPTTNFANSQFGTSVAISGDRIVVGASSESSTTANEQEGAAYIFVRSGNDWILEQRLIASDIARGSNFGISVAIETDTVVIGSSTAYVQNIRTGAAYVFTRSGGDWTQRTKLIDTVGTDSNRFGISVEIDGDTIAVGESYGNFEGQGVANGVVCIFTGAGANWTQQARIAASDGIIYGIGSNEFGSSLDIEGNTLIVGASGKRAAYIFVRNENIWIEQQKLTAINTPLLFPGVSVSISGNTAIVGLYRESAESVGNNTGTAFVFTRNENSWTKQAQLIPSNGRSGVRFGFDVLVSENKFFVSSPLISETLNGQGEVYYFISPTSAPDLQNAADTGNSNSDNLTNLRTLPFDIGGVTNGATVKLFRNGVMIDSAVAAGTSITLTDNNVPADGTYSYTSRQIVNGEEGSISQATVVTVDTAAPVVTINQETYQSDPTTNSSVVFKVIFNEPISDFDISDVSFAGSTASLSGAEFQVLSISPSIYTVGIYRVTADNQTIIANIPAGVVSDAAGNFNAVSTSYDNSVTVDNVQPRVTINQATSQSDPTAVLPINFTVVFSEPVTGFGDSFDVSLTNSTANTVGANVNITGSGTTYNVAVSGITSNGQNIQIAVQSGAAQDAAGNRNLTSTSTDNIVTLDNVRPNVTINQAPAQTDPTSLQPLNFRVVFNEPVTGFDESDVSLNGSTANVSAAQITVTGSGTTYNVAIGNILTGGLVRASIVANAAQDISSNQSNASTSTDNSIVFNLKSTAYDFDGDGKADISVFRPDGGNWYLLQSQAGFTGAQFGNSTDKLVPADYDGDGKTDIAVFRTGTWYLQRTTAGFTGVAFGDVNDIPQPADFDGDGKAELAVWRPSNGTWYVYNLVDNQFTAAQFGASTDKPVVGDYDGDGKADYAVYRPSNGTWYMQRSAAGFFGVAFGESTDKLVPADYDGDGKTDVAVYRPSNGSWYLLQSTAGFTGLQFGISTDLPVPADYDGDGKADLAVFRDGTWYLNRSTAGFTGVTFGTGTDKPVENAFIP